MWTQQLCGSEILAEILIRPNDFDITNKVEDATPDSEIEIDSEPSSDDNNTNTVNNDLQNDSKEVNNRPDFLTIFYWIIIKKGLENCKV